MRFASYSSQGSHTGLPTGKQHAGAPRNTYWSTPTRKQDGRVQQIVPASLEASIEEAPAQRAPALLSPPVKPARQHHLWAADRWEEVRMGEVGGVALVPWMLPPHRRGAGPEIPGACTAS